MFFEFITVYKLDEEYIEIFVHGREYVSLPLSNFIAGYISALPNYDKNVIQAMLLQEVNAVLQFYCAHNYYIHCGLIDDPELIKLTKENE